MNALCLPVGVIAGATGLIFSNIMLIALAAALLVWFANTNLRVAMLDTHQKNLAGETIKLGEVNVPIVACVLEKPIYSVLPPEVSQLLTWRDAGNGTITQIRLVTNFAGKTLAYPAAVFKTTRKRP